MRKEKIKFGFTSANSGTSCFYPEIFLDDKCTIFFDLEYKKQKEAESKAKKIATALNLLIADYVKKSNLKINKKGE